MIACQFAVYGIGQANLDRAVAAALAEVKASGLSYQLGPMSTQMLGEESEVFDALEKAYLRAAETGAVVMTVTISNACPVVPPAQGGAERAQLSSQS